MDEGLGRCVGVRASSSCGHKVAICKCALIDLEAQTDDVDLSNDTSMACSSKISLQNGNSNQTLDGPRDEA